MAFSRSLISHREGHHPKCVGYADCRRYWTPAIGGLSNDFICATVDLFSF
jgi:hypothetical protein